MAQYENFNYMDQLLDTEVDLTEYLKNFSDDNYTLEFRNDQPVIATIKNLFEQSTFTKDFKEADGFSFSNYLVEEEELIEDVSLNFYGSIDYWWIIAIFNDITNPMNQWPISERELQYISAELQSKENKYSAETYYNLLFDMNERKRNIRILRPDHLLDVIKDLREFITNPTTIDNNFTVIL